MRQILIVRGVTDNERIQQIVARMRLTLIPFLLIASGGPGFTAGREVIPQSLTENSPICTTTETAPEIGRLFRRNGSWVGGDVAESVPLGNGRVLWLFGDSLLGSISGSHRRISAIVNNSVAIQKGTDPQKATMEFYAGSNGGIPSAFIRPERGGGWFWLSHGGIRIGGSLYLFMPRLQRIGNESSVWGFRTDGVFMSRISNPDAVPDRWIIRQFRLPWFHRDSTGNERYFGISPLQDGKWIYIFGADYSKSTGRRNLLISRVKPGDLERFSSWEFYAEGRWQKNFMKASGLCPHVGAEFSIKRLSSYGKYVLITTDDGLSDKIMMRLADSPEGPWGPPAIIYQAPEPRRDPSLICYAAKAHPEIKRRSDELIVSYVCNSQDPRKLTSDAHIYFPEFVRVRFLTPPIRSHPGSVIP